MEWQLKKYLIPDGYVFKINLPTAAEIITVKSFTVIPPGWTEPLLQPHLVVLADTDLATFTERTFILLTEGREVSPKDAELIRNGVMVPVGEFKLTIMTFYMFEDLSETS